MVCSGLTLTTPVLLLIIESNSAGYKVGQRISKMEASTVLRLKGLTKRFGPILANDDVTIELQKGEVLALLGENGAAKQRL